MRFLSSILVIFTFFLLLSSASAQRRRRQDGLRMTPELGITLFRILPAGAGFQPLYENLGVRVMEPIVQRLTDEEKVALKETFGPAPGRRFGRCFGSRGMVQAGTSTRPTPSTQWIRGQVQRFNSRVPVHPDLDFLPEWMDAHDLSRLGPAFTPILAHFLTTFDDDSAQRIASCWFAKPTPEEAKLVDQVVVSPFDSAAFAKGMMSGPTIQPLYAAIGNWFATLASASPAVAKRMGPIGAQTGRCLAQNGFLAIPNNPRDPSRSVGYTFMRPVMQRITAVPVTEQNAATSAAEIARVMTIPSNTQAMQSAIEEALRMFGAHFTDRVLQCFILTARFKPTRRGQASNGEVLQSLPNSEAELDDALDGASDPNSDVPTENPVSNDQPTEMEEENETEEVEEETETEAELDDALSQPQITSRRTPSYRRSKPVHVSVQVDA